MRTSGVQSSGMLPFRVVSDGKTSNGASAFLFGSTVPK